MEETGVIRRLDALGRIVIPREYRKLHRIEVGDPLEMRLTTGGEITIKKVDLSAQLKTLGELAINALATYTQKRMAVCSQEEWLLFSHKSETTGDLPPEMVKAVSGQKPCLLPCGEWGLKTQAKNAALFPVIGETGVFGALVLFTDSIPTDTEHALFTAVATLTAANMQKF